MNRLSLAALFVAVATAGCSKAAAPAPAPSAAPSVAAAPASTDIPTSEDYEQAAVDQINPGNMEQSLVQLEKDIGK